MVRGAGPDAVIAMIGRRLKRSPSMSGIMMSVSTKSTDVADGVIDDQDLVRHPRSNAAAGRHIVTVVRGRPFKAISAAFCITCSNPARYSRKRERAILVTDLSRAYQVKSLFLCRKLLSHRTKTAK